MTTDTETDTDTDLGERYLGLVKRCLTRLLFFEEEVHDVADLEALGWDVEQAALVAGALDEKNLRLVRTATDRAAREIGIEFPPPRHAETMIGMARLDNVQECVADVIHRRVPGDLIEAGVWRGGTTILMRAVLAAHGDTSRTVWAADSFEGVPAPDPVRYPADAGLEMFSRVPGLAVGIDEVRANFARYGLLDDQVQFLHGWFKDTLPTAPIERLAVIRLDGDLYESTMDALVALYPKLSVGGYIVIDDYNNIRACRRAVSDYRVDHGIGEEIRRVDWNGAFWQREG